MKIHLCGLKKYNVINLLELIQVIDDEDNYNLYEKKCIYKSYKRLFINNVIDE